MARVPMTSMNPIKRAREERGITQAQLADEIGVRQQSISRWEQSRGRPEPEHMETLQLTLHLSRDDMATLAKIPQSGENDSLAFADSMANVTTARAARVVALSESLQREIDRLAESLPAIIASSDLVESDIVIIRATIGELSKRIDKLPGVFDQILQDLEHRD